MARGAAAVSSDSSRRSVRQSWCRGWGWDGGFFGASNTLPAVLPNASPRSVGEGLPGSNLAEFTSMNADAGLGVVLDRDGLLERLQRHASTPADAGESV